MKVMVILLIVGVLETAANCLKRTLKELEIRGRIGIIQTTALFTLARILRGILEI